MAYYRERVVSDAREEGEKGMNSSRAAWWGHASTLAVWGKANPAVRGMVNPCWLHDNNVWAGEWCRACLNNERELEW